MHSPKYFQERIGEELAGLSFPSTPSELYEPIRYMMSLGGKRIRPALVLMSNELFGSDPEKIIKVALGLEVFHNFTLMHDDIMDRAPLRRNKSTVHTKWNPNIAILSGDTMFVMSCQLVMNTDPKYSQEVLSLFFKTATQVCEGQQLDMNFESRGEVSINEYIEMISLKTAVLLGCSLKIGAILAGAKADDTELMYSFGKNLGIAFQLHDDILDLYGEAEKFGKQVGGDILSNKKTILLLLALSHENKQEVDKLKVLINNSVLEPEKKIVAVREIFERLEIRKKAEQEMEKYFKLALHSFQKVKVEDSRKEILSNLAERLMVRES